MVKLEGTTFINYKFRGEVKFIFKELIAFQKSKFVHWDLQDIVLFYILNVSVCFTAGKSMLLERYIF